MKISDVMTRDVKVVSPEASIAEAARKMKELDVGPLPVCDGDRVLGIVTDRDLVVRGLAEGLGLDATVRDVMTEKVEWLFQDHDVAKAAELMKDKQIRRVIVVDRNKKLVGIVSLADLARRLEADKAKGEVLEEVSQPSDTTH